MTRRLIALCFIAVTTLTACSSGDDPKAGPKPAALKLPEPGQCIAKEAKDLDNVGPDYTSVVDCKKPHVYEIVDVLNVPKKFVVGGSREKRLERRTELAKSTASGSLAKDFHAYADRGCHEATLRATGLDGVLIGDKEATEADVRPVLLGARTSTSVGPPELWAGGKPRIVCSFRYTAPTAPTGTPGKVFAIQSPSSVPIYLDLLSEHFPAERRACGTYDSDNYMYAVLCTNQHNTETLFSYDAGAAFGTKFAGSVDPEAVTDPHWDKLVTPCADSLIDVVGFDIEEELVGSVYLDDDWSSTPTAYCLITFLSDKSDMPPGSVVGQAGEVKEVPAKKVDRRLGPYAKRA